MPSRTPSRRYPTVEEARRTLAAEAWRPLIDFIVATGPRRSRVFGEFGLTPNDGRALASLAATTGRSMGSLAEEWGCDASTATWVVDRLVAKGLAERRELAGDRRVKLVALTASGERLRRAIRERVHEAPPELLELSDDELRALRDAATKLPGDREG
jgi:DNA-binding MarR family transcriptional regulator